MMHHMDLLVRTARKEGLLALEDAAKEIPAEIGFYQDIQSAVSYVCGGLEVSLKGLSAHAIKKLFSAMPDYKADEYASNCEYMGPVRKIDVMASMSELIAIFEKRAENKERKGGKDWA